MVDLTDILFSHFLGFPVLYYAVAMFDFNLCFTVIIFTSVYQPSTHMGVNKEQCCLYVVCL